MHHKVSKLSQASSGARIPCTSTLVTILTALLSLVSREAVPPWTHHTLQTVPVTLRRPEMARTAGNPYRRHRNRMK